MREKNELDILIPVFNEDETIVKTIKNISSVVKDPPLRFHTQENWSCLCFRKGVGQVQRYRNGTQKK